MADTLLRKISTFFLQPRIYKKIRRTTFYSYDGIDLKIPPGVFHPKYFFSTHFLLEYMLKLPLKNKTFLELGAGSGLIAMQAARNGAVVTASDISEKVVEALKENAGNNHVEVHSIQSDMFDAIPQQTFDVIAINPPYYPKNPRNEFEQAWYCGEGFEYFEKLFSGLGNYMDNASIVRMILSEECQINTIESIAAKNSFTFTEAAHKKIYWELNYIFEIRKTA